MRTLAVAVVCWFVCAAQTLSAERESLDAPHILVLNSYHQGFQWTDELLETVNSDLTEIFPDAELHVVYLDRKRHLSQEHLDLVREQLSLWYQQDTPDVVITSDDAALSFVKQWEDQLFPQVPVVFCGVNDIAQLNELPENYCGILEKLDIKENIELTRSILPNTTEIVVVTDGTPTGLGARREVEAYAGEFSGLTFSYLKGEELSTDEMLQELERLKKGAVVIAPAWYLDQSGHTFSNREIYPMITQRCPVPVIVTSSANLEFGALGGKVNSGETQGRYAALLASRILQGTASPADLGVEVDSRNRYAFDYRQLQRFAIPEARLPEGSLLLFRTFSFYESYRTLVWVVVGLFAVFLSMILALLGSVHRLRCIKSDLKQSRENLKITLDSIGDAVISTDIQYRIVNMNPVAEDLTGWALKDVQGKPLPRMIKLLDEETRQPGGCAAREVLSSGESVVSARGILLTRDSAEYQISISGSPIRNLNGDSTGVVLVFRDMSEEYALQEQLQQSQKMDAIGQLAGGIAHDFNNSLGGILGAAELAQIHLEQQEDPRDLLDIIIETSHRASALTKKLLTFARKQPASTSIIDLRQPIQDALLLFESTGGKQVQIHSKLHPDELKVKGDPVLLQNSILNLLINASHAMPKGGDVYVTSRLTELDEASCLASSFDLSPGPYVCVEVRDTGCGISPEHISRIYDPFFSTKGAGKGTGLGLSAVFGTVKQHRGAISVYSEEGRGASFHLLLPLTDCPLETTRSVRPEHLQGSGTILIVDDEEVMRKTGSLILSGLGYTVLLAEDGAQGVDVFKEEQHRIDLVLLDMIMPNMNGPDCFRALRRMSPDIPIVIASGFSQEEELQGLKEEGLSGFIHKPYRRSELGAIIKSVFVDS